MDTVDSVISKLILKIAEDSIAPIIARVKILEDRIKSGPPTHSALSTEEILCLLKSDALENKAELESLQQDIERVTPQIEEALKAVDGIIESCNKIKKTG